MNFNGRWVPLEVMDTILLSWMIVAVLVAVVLIRFARFRAANKPDKGKPHKGNPAQSARDTRKKRKARRKP